MLRSHNKGLQTLYVPRCCVTFTQCRSPNTVCAQVLCYVHTMQVSKHCTCPGVVLLSHNAGLHTLYVSWCCVTFTQCRSPNTVRTQVLCYVHTMQVSKHCTCPGVVLRPHNAGLQTLYVPRCCVTFTQCRSPNTVRTQELCYVHTMQVSKHCTCPGVVLRPHNAGLQTLYVPRCCVTFTQCRSPNTVRAQVLCYVHTMQVSKHCTCPGVVLRSHNAGLQTLYVPRCCVTFTQCRSPNTVRAQVLCYVHTMQVSKHCTCPGVVLRSHNAGLQTLYVPRCCVTFTQCRSPNTVRAQVLCYVHTMQVSKHCTCPGVVLRSHNAGLQTLYVPRCCVTFTQCRSPNTVHAQVLCYVHTMQVSKHCTCPGVVLRSHNAGLQTLYVPRYCVTFTQCRSPNTVRAQVLCYVHTMQVSKHCTCPGVVLRSHNAGLQTLYVPRCCVTFTQCRSPNTVRAQVLCYVHTMQVSKHCTCPGVVLRSHNAGLQTLNITYKILLLNLYIKERLKVSTLIGHVIYGDLNCI